MEITYKVKQNDLKGEIKDFPIEVVQKMVEEQVHQGNKADVGVFQIDPSFCAESGGFDWTRTKEGDEFWNSVIGNVNFDVFFKKYPKKIDTQEVIPKFLLDRKRIEMLKEGMKRYLDTDKVIPVDWVAEYNELCSAK